MRQKGEISILILETFGSQVVLSYSRRRRKRGGGRERRGWTQQGSVKKAKWKGRRMGEEKMQERHEREKAFVTRQPPKGESDDAVSRISRPQGRV